jgi:hypothetical protein
MVLSIALCGLSFAHAQQVGERTTLSGVFTAEQAKNGERIFQSRCAACRGSNLHATDPPVTGMRRAAAVSITLSSGTACTSLVD